MEANVIMDGVKYNYHVTKDGRVFSLNYNHTGRVRELKYNTNKYGYRCVNLYKNGKMKTVKVATLVALTYIPNPEGKPSVDHINRDKLNNRVENLRWATYSEQMFNKGKYKRPNAPKNIKGSKSVMCIETGKIYPSTMEVKRQLGFDQSSIGKCCRGKLKTAYGYHWQYVKDGDISE